MLKGAVLGLLLLPSIAYADTLAPQSITELNHHMLLTKEEKHHQAEWQCTSLVRRYFDKAQSFAEFDYATLQYIETQPQDAYVGYFRVTALKNNKITTKLYEFRCMIDDGYVVQLTFAWD